MFRRKEALATLFAMVIVELASSQSSGTFPGEPFNGMQIIYSISGANVTKTSDSPGFTWRRTIQGALGNDELRVHGKATLTSGWGYTLRVSVQAGNKSKSIDFAKKVNEAAEFDVAVPILKTATSGSVSISMVGSYNAGTRGVVISAALSQFAPIVVDTKPTHKKLSPSARLTKILNLFMSTIKPGSFGSGRLNNIASWIPFTSRFDETVCGMYQSKVLAFMDSLKWSSDPEVRALLEGYDYGPIQAYYGCHQAVVLYPKGSDWKTSGIVLDPWVEQKANYYAAAEWIRMFSLNTGVDVGIGGSGVYEKYKHYPTVGGDYVNPSSIKLTDAERVWVKSLPQEDRDKLKAVPDAAERNLMIKNAFLHRGETGLAIVNCPVNVSLVGAGGQTLGFTSSGFVGRPNGAEVNRMRNGANDWTTFVRFDPTRGFEMRFDAVGSGQVEVDVVHGLDRDVRKASKYVVEVGRGERLTLGVARPNDRLVTGRGGSVSPTILSGGQTGPSAYLGSVIYDNNNVYGVSNGPKVIEWITFNRDVLVTKLETYHWNSGRGTRGGSMSFVEKSTGHVIGPWTATGSAGMGGVPNATWAVYPNVLVRRGTYRIVVSSPDTWSYNAQSRGGGFAKIWARNP